MCGIVGYVGEKQASPIVLSGLKRLEYRGYDSAGLAALEIQNGHLPRLKIKRCEGKLENLIRSLEADPIQGTSSIGHTRWATHGKPSEKNAHPHHYKDVVIVHNGIIENHFSLKESLVRKGHQFSSETDSEVIAHLLQSHLDQKLSFEEACQKMVGQLHGAFAIAALCAKEPSKLFVAKLHCPMVLGMGLDEKFIASDIPALLEFTKDFIFLSDGEMAFVEPKSFVIKRFNGRVVEHQAKHIDWSLKDAEMEGFNHFMQKEIYEQPRALMDTLLGRIKPQLDGVQFDTVKWKLSDWKKVSSVSLVACGTAFHASLVGKYWIERFAKIHADVDLASEFRYRKPVPLKNSLCVAVSQSGETADTLAALQEGIRLKLTPLAITNTVESSMARKAKNAIYTHAGLEVAVASTKCFIAQLGVLALFAIRLAEVRKTQSPSWIKKALKDLSEVPEKITEVLKLDSKIRDVAKELLKFEQYFYLGRGLSYPMALEGALKLKEIAYINTQAYPAGEMKHGPIALISEHWPVVCLAPDDSVSSKMMSNIEEVKARGGRVMSIGTQGNHELESKSDVFIGIPKIREDFSPFLTAIVMQFFAYHMSVLRGCDVDKPRNLAKSVTVE